MKAADHFKKSEEQHQALSDHCNTKADAFEKAGLDDCAKEERACAKVHGERAMHYKAMAGAAADKAILDELAKARAELAPTQVRGTIPTNPNHTAVLRPGAPSLQMQKPNVDEEFQDLVKVADDRDE